MKKIKKIRQVQFDILTKTKGYHREGMILTPNPFYGSSLDTIKREIKKAKEVYRNVFQYNFVPAWCQAQAGTNSALEVINKITTGQIPPIPNYEEMKELRII